MLNSNNTKKLDWFRLELAMLRKSQSGNKYPLKKTAMIAKDKAYLEEQAFRSNFPISCLVTFRHKKRKGKFWAAANKSKLRLLETSFLKMFATKEHTLITAIIALPEACRCLLYTRNVKDLIFCIACLRSSFRKYIFITCCEPDSSWEIYDAL